MKKTLISASIASVLTLVSFGALADGPNFYGRLDLSVSHSDTGATIQDGKSGTVLETNSSRLGVKGSETISEGFDIIYQMEFQVENTSTNSDVFKARSTYLGLKTQGGTVLVGRNDTVFKKAEGGVDLFGSRNADINRMIGGQSRKADGVWYYSPKIAGLVTLNATYLMEDNYTDDAGKESYEDQYALSATLGDKKLRVQNYYAAVAYNTIGGIDAYRVVGQVKLGDFKLGSLFQNTESQTTPNKEGNSYFVNLAYQLNGVNLKAQYGKDEAGFGKYYKNITKDTVDIDTATDVNVQVITIGADYKIAKSTQIYGHYAMYQGDYELAGIKVDLEDDNIFTVGVRYNF
ncbi:porin [Shewanella violacea]|uniref:Outer membrane porin, putative n=1 Tax=Shewanella violacea (strain JCM 10179 / CIP 106290 / LMG 19151 / DSS12) TaxID=637905 RepID=D4ZCC7_SHEVD|nr:porin [Shewanella violacea]BAJ03672.1 outer membrane porin, putative [Shewanella violacea DSS12]